MIDRTESHLIAQELRNRSASPHRDGGRDGVRVIRTRRWPWRSASVREPVGAAVDDSTDVAKPAR
jgi:hypothetical protein